MRILGWVGWLVMFVMMLPLMLLGGVAAAISNVLVGAGEKADQTATNHLGEAYTNPRKAIAKLLAAILIGVVVLWILSMAFGGSSGSNCDYGRTGARCEAW